MGKGPSLAPPAGGHHRSALPPGRLRRRAALCGLVAAGSLGLAAPAGAQSHVVRPGETASEIAARHGITTAALQQANALGDPHRIVAGTVLTIPTRSGSGGRSTSSASTHTVAPGDTLSGIARRHGLSTAELARANGITDPHRVRPGQVLSVGGGAGSSVAAGPASYQVQPGDALSTVAERAGTTTAELLRLNGLSNRDHIRVGQVLRLPAGGSAPATTRTATTSPTVRAVSQRYPNLPAKLLAHPERMELVPRFERWAAHYGVSVEFLMGVTWLESGWQNHVVSHAGAVGIGQLMPVTSRWLADEIIGVPSLDPQVPDDNIRMSAAFLAWLQRSMGSRDLALAGYYQGPTAVKLLGVYPVTDVYVTAANALIERFRPA